MLLLLELLPPAVICPLDLLQMVLFFLSLLDVPVFESVEVSSQAMVRFQGVTLYLYLNIIGRYSKWLHLCPIEVAFLVDVEVSHVAAFDLVCFLLVGCDVTLEVVAGSKS